MGHWVVFAIGGMITLEFVVLLIQGIRESYRPRVVRQERVPAAARRERVGAA